MQNRLLKVTMAGALLVTISACKTVPAPLPVSDTGQTRTESSWCQGDAPLRYSQADSAGVNDPGNVLDSDATVTELQEHNARYRAACPTLPSS